MKNQYRLDDLVTLVNVERTWWAIAKDVGDYIGYKKPSSAFNEYCTEGEVIIQSVQYKDQKRATQLVSRVGIYDLLEKTSLDIPDEKVKWICEKLIKTMKVLNEGSYLEEMEIAQAECKEKNQKEDTSKLEKVKENSIKKNRINQLEKDKDRLLSDIEKRNIRIRELTEDNKKLEETIRHKDLKIQDRDKRIEELKYELKNINKISRDLEIEILHLDSEGGIEKVELLESDLEDANFKIKVLDNDILDLAYKNRDLEECKCFFCKLKERAKSWLS